MRRILAFLYGLVCYAAFLASFAYAVGFVSNLVVPKTIDSGTAGALAPTLLVDGLLLSLFALQHSVMARPAFKRWWTRMVSPTIERSTYVLLSSLVLGLVFWQWRPLPATVWSVHNPTLAVALRALRWVGWAMIVASTYMIDHFRLFGVKQVTAALRQEKLPIPRFVTPLLYRIVRHPLMLGFFIAFWATPTMSQGHLLFAVATTAYILVAVQFEERDLVDLFGEDYERYRQEVPAFLPRPRPTYTHGTELRTAVGEGD